MERAEMEKRMPGADLNMERFVVEESGDGWAVFDNEKNEWYLDRNMGDPEFSTREEAVKFAEWLRFKTGLRWGGDIYDRLLQVRAFYFDAPAALVLSLLPDRYADKKVIGTEISVTCTCGKDGQIGADELADASVQISPTVAVPGGSSDIDWNDVELPEEYLAEMFRLIRDRNCQKYAPAEEAYEWDLY